MAYGVKFRLEFSDDLENGKKNRNLKRWLYWNCI